MNPTYCGNHDSKGHGDSATCGEIYYGPPRYQCRACLKKDIESLDAEVKRLTESRKSVVQIKLDAQAEVYRLKSENESLRREMKDAPDLYPNVIRIKRDSPEYSAAWMAWADEQHAMRKDAMRYRWLRAQDDFEVVLNCGAELDKVVDRKMAASDEN